MDEERTPAEGAEEQPAQQPTLTDLLERLDRITERLGVIADQTKRPERQPLPGKVDGADRPKKRTLYDM